MIVLNNVSKTFYSNSNKQFKAIDNISLSIFKNEIFGIIGESGAGKSTLLRLINFLEIPDSGTVKIEEQDISKYSKNKLRLFRKNIGMIFQEFNLLENKTVKENILLPLKLHTYKNHLDLEEILQFVGLKNFKNSYPSELSGGQKQRVGIARALITRPQILLCDEPTSALDYQTKQEIITLLKQIANEFSITILIVSHELDVIKDLCNRAAILEDGNLVEVLNINKAISLETKGLSYYDHARKVLTDD